jgi:hypothetical protein
MFVVDTNVIIVANKGAKHVSPDCVKNCAQRLNLIKNEGHIVLDAGHQIFNEYRNKTLRRKGQREVGDEFVLWVISNMWNPTKCTQVRLTPKNSDNADFHEFPNHVALADFDRSDRVFVAVANAHETKPPLCVACDTDHWNCRVALADCGITVDFLCPSEIEVMAKRKAR